MSQHEPLLDGVALAGSPAADDATSQGAGRQSFVQLYERLRHDVLAGELTPGSILSQVQLADRYEVSRAPLREALRMLQSEGLIEAQPQRRSRIADVSAPDLEQLYALRITIEALAIRLTVKQMTDADIAQLRQLTDEMDALAQSRDFGRWEVPHRAFHRALVHAAGERVLTTINGLSDHAERYRRILLEEPRAWSAVPAEHAAIVDACESREAELAANRLAAHLATTALRVGATLAPEHEPAAVREALRIVRGAQEPD